MPVLDLTKPGKFWATAENERETIFHLVIPDDRYTPDRLTANPNISPADQLMKPWTVSAPDSDKTGGKAELDLGKTGRAKEIIDKLGARFDQGLPALKQVRGIVIVTAAQGNRVPAKQLADVIDLELGPLPAIKLEAARGFVTVQNFKGGWKEFIVNLRVQGMQEVELKASPGAQIRANPGPKGNGAIKVPVKEGQQIQILIPVPLTQKKQSEQRRVKKRYRHYVPGGWRSRQYGDWTTATFQREVWTGGDITLTARGTGDLAGIKRTVKLRAEAWASAWLCLNPPPVLSHNIC